MDTLKKGQVYIVTDVGTTKFEIGQRVIYTGHSDGSHYLFINADGYDTSKKYTGGDWSVEDDVMCMWFSRINGAVESIEEDKPETVRIRMNKDCWMWEYELPKGSEWFAYPHPDYDRHWRVEYSPDCFAAVRHSEAEEIPGDIPEVFKNIRNIQSASGSIEVVSCDTNITGLPKARCIVKDEIPHQVGGSHYCQYPIEPITFIQENNVPFCEGNVIKYIMRWRDKGGVDDLRKAKQYIDFLIDKELKVNPTR